MPKNREWIAKRMKWHQGKKSGHLVGKSPKEKHKDDEDKVRKVAEFERESSK